MNKTTVVFIRKMLRLLFYMSEYKFLFNVTFLSNPFDNVLILRYLVNLTYKLRIKFSLAWKRKWNFELGKLNTEMLQRLELGRTQGKSSSLLGSVATYLASPFCL